MIYMWFTGINYYKLAVEKDRDSFFMTITTIWKPGFKVAMLLQIKLATFVSFSHSFRSFVRCFVEQASNQLGPCKGRNPGTVNEAFSDSFWNRRWAQAALSPSPHTCTHYISLFNTRISCP
jgi:hypothetical protein